MAEAAIDKLQDDFDRAKQSILQNLDFYDTQMSFKSKMQELFISFVATPGMNS